MKRGSKRPVSKYKGTTKGRKKKKKLGVVGGGGGVFTAKRGGGAFASSPVLKSSIEKTSIALCPPKKKKRGGMSHLGLTTEKKKTVEPLGHGEEGQRETMFSLGKNPPTSPLGGRLLQGGKKGLMASTPRLQMRKKRGSFQVGNLL